MMSDWMLHLCKVYSGQKDRPWIMEEIEGGALVPISPVLDRHIVKVFVW